MKGARDLVNGVIRNTLGKFVMYFWMGNKYPQWREKKNVNRKETNRTELIRNDGKVKAEAKSGQKVFESIVKKNTIFGGIHYYDFNYYLVNFHVGSIGLSDHIGPLIFETGKKLLLLILKIAS